MTPTEQADQAKNPLSPHLLAHPFLDGGVGGLMMRAASAYQADYVMSLDEGADHTPTEFEGWLLEDFWNGLMSEESFFGPVRLLIDALTALQARVGELEGALKPFASFAQDNIEADSSSPGYGVWSGNRCEGERIKDWFGPTDFYRAALLTPPAPHSDEAGS